MKALLQIAAHAFVRVLLRIFYGLRVPRQIAEHPCLIVANHNTHLDVFALFTLVPLSCVPRVRAVAAGDYFGAGIMGWVGRFLFNVVLVDRTSHSRHNDPLQPVAEAVAAGHSLIVFPEGSRGEPGKVRSFKAGIGELALRFPHLPIHPVALAGIERTMPRSRPLPIPFNISVLACAPLRIADLDLPDDHRTARRLIAAELQQRIEVALTPEGKSLGLLRVLSFDGDMTLWDFQKLMRHSLGHALEELRRRVSTQ